MTPFTSTRTEPSTSNGNSVSQIIGRSGEIAADARQRLAEAEEMLKTVVINRPVMAVGVALAVGVILGWLIKRR